MRKSQQQWLNQSKAREHTRLVPENLLLLLVLCCNSSRLIKNYDLLFLQSGLVLQKGKVRTLQNLLSHHQHMEELSLGLALGAHSENYKLVRLIIILATGSQNPLGLALTEMWPSLALYPGQGSVVCFMQVRG